MIWHPNNQRRPFMPPIPADSAIFLFVPADKPERFAKAAASGADAIIIDLEDAVAPGAKGKARSAMQSVLKGEQQTCPTFIRINGTATQWHDEDIAAASALPITGVILPKAENGAEVVAVRAQLLASCLIIAIIESARGLATADEIAESADRLAFGSIDFATDLGCAHERESLLLARSKIVIASRLAERPAPIDGVTLLTKDAEAIEADSRYAAALGFGGKLLIHPAQVEPCRIGFAPRPEEVSWATKVLAGAEDAAARAVDGIMVDAPVLARARQIITAHQRFSIG